MLKFKKFEGLVAAPFTPMDSKGNLVPELIPEYYDFLAVNGVTGAFINGSTGEGPSLTQKEKFLQAEQWAKCLKNDGRVRVINMVGGTSYGECRENAVFSYEIGLSAVAMVAPYYFRPANPGALAEFVAMTGESVPEMPVYFYHIPVLTGVKIPMLEFLKKITNMLPNFAGLKYTDEDLMDFMSCINYEGGTYDMLYGRDECMLPALALGCRGFVGSTYNYAAPLYHALISAFDKGDLKKARELQQKSIDMIYLLDKYGGMNTGKAYMKLAGFDFGKFRTPVTRMADERFNEFREDVRLLDMDHLFSKK
ncbi:MAG TPA: dihydrodipicolinate synthase family protein [Bacteroidales bacterium]|jgi:N-acetylneuraminate lyase|nr:dihydrodipicolinate synthase family protein [Bacteroidales bacterium]HQH23980.1 dihydrodipicolinate synthase family protein [Bacteroidales bacterium]HQJ81310.1 dihydrodipicolinate synthase family protein [Bacteroidales bacterium]